MHSVLSLKVAEKENKMQMLWTVNQGKIKAQMTKIILILQCTQEDMQNTDNKTQTQEKWSFTVNKF